MTAGRITTAEYVTRHMAAEVSTVDYANLSVLAAHDRRGDGRVRMTNAEIAAVRGKSERTVRLQTARLVKDGRWLQRIGWTWVIVGAGDHDVRYCGHGECIIDATADRMVGLRDELAILRRKRDAERKRLARQKKRAQTA